MITPEQHSIALYLDDTAMYALVRQTSFYTVVGDAQLREDLDLLWDGDGLFNRMCGNSQLPLFRMPIVLQCLDEEMHIESNKNFRAAYARMTLALTDLTLLADTHFELPDYDA